MTPPFTIVAAGDSAIIVEFEERIDPTVNARAIGCAESIVAAAIAGEYSSRAVAAVRRGREADDENARCRVAESRQRLGPVFLPPITQRRFLGDLFAPADETRALAASNHRSVELFERGHAESC